MSHSEDVRPWSENNILFRSTYCSRYTSHGRIRKGWVNLDIFDRNGEGLRLTCRCQCLDAMREEYKQEMHSFELEVYERYPTVYPLSRMVVDLTHVQRLSTIEIPIGP